MLDVLSKGYVEGGEEKKERRASVENIKICMTTNWGKLGQIRKLIT